MESVMQKICSECESTNIIHEAESGEYICSCCGLVLQKLELDKGPEWRAFTIEEKDTRTRASKPLDLIPATIIGKISRDSRGNQLSQSKISQMFRLRKWQRRTRAYASTERNLINALSELDGLASRLHISSVVREEAARIYYRALKKGMVKGRSIRKMVAASLYAACRLTGIPRTLIEISKSCSESAKEISQCYRLIHDELHLDIPNPDSRLRVSRIADTIGVSERTRRKAVEILTAAKRAKATSGKHPVGLAAAALYLAGLLCEEWITQETLANASGITEVTIRNRYKKLEEVMEDEK